MSLTIVLFTICMQPFVFQLPSFFLIYVMAKMLANLYLIALQLIARFTSGSELNCTKKMHLKVFPNYIVQLCLIWL